MEPFQQRDPLPAEDRIPQLVDGMSPHVALGSRRLGRTATCAAEHRDQRGKLFLGRVALDDLDVRLVPVVGLLGLLPVVRLFGHSGMFPCFFGGSWAILRSSSRRAVATYPRVCDGGITASTYPRSAAM